MPANGADLKIVIDNVKLSRVGDYGFKSISVTKEAEVLTSGGIGKEESTLTVI